MKLMETGCIVIILAGRFKGKRVIFLRDLSSGILITGPHEVNGVPLRRVNRAFVLPTRFKLNLDGLDLSSVSASGISYPARPHPIPAKNVRKGRWNQQLLYSNAQFRAVIGKMVDPAIAHKINHVPHLRKYLS